jgi:signal transduction histidine kinase
MHWPAPTIRLRLTVMYGLVFLVTGVVLLSLGYVLVRHNLFEPANEAAVRAQLQKQGIVIAAPPGAFLRSTPLGAAVLVAKGQLRAQALNKLLVEYLLALGLTTAISVAAGWLLAGRALRPLRQITATARRVSGENLGERIALDGPADELRELADTFDGMLARLDDAFGSQRHFVANASHELRTPLAIMRAEVDVALADPDPGDADLRRMAETVRETIDRCERLLESLLTLARSEAATGHQEPVDLAALAADCVTDLRARAEELQLQVRDELRPAPTRGDPALLERMIANLLDNAIRHNERGGFISVRAGVEQGRAGSGGDRGQFGAGAEHGQAVVTVANGGPAIDEADARALTEPFRRLERTRGGFGLGLSIVRSVVDAHRGSLAVEARPEGGLAVRVSLPAAAPAPDTLKKTPRALTKS